MSNIGFATLSVVPSLRGMDAAITKQLGGPLAAASATAGTKSATALGGSFTSKLGSLTKGATLPFIGIGVAAISSAKSVEDAQNTILRATGATGKAADGLLASFKNVAKGSAAPFATVATTLAEVSQRTGLVGKPLEGLTSQIVSFNRITKDAPIGVKDLTQTLAGFKVPAEQSGAALDKLFTISQKTGVPLAALNSTLGSSGAILRQFKLPLDQSASLLAKLDKAGVPASAAMGGLKKAFTTFAKAGQDPKTALVGVLGLIDKLVKAGDTKGAQQLGAKIFGARGVGLVDAAIQGKLAIGDLTKTVPNLGKGIAATAASTSTMAGKLGVLKNNAQLALAELGGPLLDAATTGLKSIVPVVQTMANGFSSLPGPLKTVAVGLVALGAVAGPIGKLAGGIGKIGKAASKTGKLLFGASEDARGFFRSGGGASKLASGIASASKSVFNFGKNALLAAGNIAKQTAAFVIQKGAMLAAAAAQKVLTAAQWLLNAAMTANPVGLIVAGIAALAAGIFIAYKKFKPFREVVDAVGRAFVKMGKVIGTVVVGAFRWIKSHWPLLLGILTGPFGLAVLAVVKFGPKVLAGVKGAFKGVVGFFKGLPGEILSALGNVGSLLLDVGKRIVGGLLTGAKAILSVYLAFYVKLPVLILGKVAGAASWLIDTGSKIIGGLLDGVTSGASAVFNFFAGLGARILRGLGRVGSWLLDVGGKIIGGLYNGIVGFWTNTLAPWINGVRRKVLGAIGNAAVWLFDKGKDLFNGLRRGIVSVAGIAFHWFGQLRNKIVDAIGDARRWLLQVGHDIVGGLVDGIVAAWHFVTDKLHSLAKHLPSWIKGPLGIKSPSTVFAKVGGHLIAGLVVGIDAGTGPLKKRLAGVSKLVAGTKLAFPKPPTPPKIAAPKFAKPKPPPPPKFVAPKAPALKVPIPKPPTLKPPALKVGLDFVQATEASTKRFSSFLRGLAGRQKKIKTPIVPKGRFVTPKFPTLTAPTMRAAGDQAAIGFIGGIRKRFPQLRSMFSQLGEGLGASLSDAVPKTRDVGKAKPKPDRRFTSESTRLGLGPFALLQKRVKQFTSKGTREGIGPFALLQKRIERFTSKQDRLGLGPFGLLQKPPKFTSKTTRPGLGPWDLLKKGPTAKDFKAGLEFAAAMTESKRAIVQAPRPKVSPIEQANRTAQARRPDVKVVQEISMRHDVATPAELEYLGRRLAWAVSNTGRKP